MRQRPHDDKYVSVFQSGDASVDLTFRDPILSQSADHYAVGVDELTVKMHSAPEGVSEQSSENECI